MQGDHGGVNLADSGTGLQSEDRLQQLLKERDDLKQLLNEQLETISAHTARINGLEEDLMDMQNATKIASQVSRLGARPSVELHCHMGPRW